MPLIVAPLQAVTDLCRSMKNLESLMDTFRLKSTKAKFCLLVLCSYYKPVLFTFSVQCHPCILCLLFLLFILMFKVAPQCSARVLFRFPSPRGCDKTRVSCVLAGRNSSTVKLSTSSTPREQE